MFPGIGPRKEMDGGMRRTGGRDAPGEVTRRARRCAGWGVSVGE